MNYLAYVKELSEVEAHLNSLLIEQMSEEEPEEPEEEPEEQEEEPEEPEPKIRATKPTKEDLEDNQLLSQHSEGDPEAFKKLYNKYSRYAGTVAGSMTRRGESSEDVVNKSFDDISTHLRKGGKIDNFKNFLSSRIQRNAIGGARKLQSKMRDVSRQTSIDATGDSESEDPFAANIPDTSKGSNPQEEVNRQENVKALSSAIKQLDPMHQKVITLHYIQNKTFQQIADELGINFNTLKVSMMPRILQQLRDILTGE
jgi:RNA polymerase sigma factor (sigma-70 family)